jgi:peptidoglycan/xylan/chitin deacetylase (PgdA/CDA1 family)
VKIPVLEKLLSPLRYSSGSFERDWRRRAAARGVTVVACYHHIKSAEQASPDDFPAEAGVSLECFCRHMEFLLRHFRPVKPSEATDPAPGLLRCAVTFDDGFLDNYTLAAPVLRRLGIPAGFFVCTDYVGTQRWFWWEAVAESLRRTGKSRLEAEKVLPRAVADKSIAGNYALTDHAARQRACEDVLGWLGRQPQAVVDLALGELGRHLDVDLSSLPRRKPLMGWEHVRDLRKQGFEIGGHSANHINLAHANAEELQRELVDSHSRLEAESAGPVSIFAYPYGRTEHLSPAAVEMVRRLGYASAFTTLRGVADGSHDPLLTPRLHLNPRWFFGCAYNVQSAFRGQAGAACSAPL